MELDFIDISQEPRPRKISRREYLRRKKLRRIRKIKRFFRFFIMSVILIILGYLFIHLLCDKNNIDGITSAFHMDDLKVVLTNKTEKPEISENYLSINPYSRPGENHGKIKNIFVHYTANPGTSANQNRSYFENLAQTGETSASAHFVIGYEGEIVQCIPLEEIGYAVKTRNFDSISIECCYLDENGKFTEETYHSLIVLSAWLLREYKLSPDDMRRHYDEGGKMCPLYYVVNEEEWEKFKDDLKKYILEK